MNNLSQKNKILLSIYTVAILIIAYFTYFRNYTIPERTVWDERYYVSSGEKYLNSVMFFQSHPPLAKLFIALGEYIFQPNKDKEWFEFNYKIMEELKKSIFSEEKIRVLNNLKSKELFKEDLIENLKKENFTEEEINLVLSKAKKINILYLIADDSFPETPEGYSFKGLRFFPVIFATLSSILFFYILYFISKNSHISFLFSFLYLFENALIVHSRAAMLDGIQIFFILLAILYFFYIIREKSEIKISAYLILGFLTGLAVSVKSSSLVLLFLFIFLFLLEQGEKGLKLSLSFFKDLLIKVILSTSAIAFVFLMIFYIHCSLGKNIVNNNFYGASDRYKEILEKGETGNLKHFPLMLKENYLYMKHELTGVPPAEYKKATEAGSRPVLWPLGWKGITYMKDMNDGRVKCLQLQGNPLIWLTGLLSFIISAVIAAGTYIFRKPVKNRKIFISIIYLLTLYISYMTVMVSLKRGMYLYSYLVPLIFTLILAFLNFYYIFEEKILKNKRIIYIAMGIFCFALVLIYRYYSPVTYYEPLFPEELEKRMWSDFWQ